MKKGFFLVRTRGTFQGHFRDRVLAQKSNRFKYVDLSLKRTLRPSFLHVMGGVRGVPAKPSSSTPVTGGPGVWAGSAVGGVGRTVA